MPFTISKHRLGRTASYCSMAMDLFRGTASGMDSLSDTRFILLDHNSVNNTKTTCGKYVIPGQNHLKFLKSCGNPSYTSVASRLIRSCPGQRHAAASIKRAACRYSARRL